MATTRVMTTVLPYSVDPGDPFHVSLFFSHRLEGGGTLVDYPVMQDWVTALRGATIRLHTDSSPTPIVCTPLLTPNGDTRIVVPDENAWRTAFPGTTAVHDYPQPTVTNVPWNSYPANRTPDHALEAHYAATCWSPVARPGVLGNPLAEELLDELSKAEGVRPLVEALKGYPEARDNRRKRLIQAKNDGAREALAPTKPPPTIVEPPKPQEHQPHALPDTAPLKKSRLPEPPWRSPIELLLAEENKTVDALITAFLDNRLANPPAPPEKNPPILQMLLDVHQAQKYYNRPEEQPKPTERPDRPTPGTLPPPRTPHDAPDFHERAAAVCNVPALARTLGLVVDVRVDDLAALRAATTIRCDVVIDGAEEDLSPETLCTTSGNRFLAVPQTDRWRAGRLGLGDPARYRVMDLDPDAVGLSLEQLLRSVIRALAIEVNGDRGSFAPPTLRATGFALAELDRPNELRQRVAKAEGLERQQSHRFNYEELLRGTRVEVWDDVTRIWHNLHERRVDVSFDDEQPPFVAGLRDVGYLQNPPLSRTPGNDAHPYYVHEVLAGWDGWSLSAPRLGRLVIYDRDGEHGPPGSEHITDKPEVKDAGLGVQSTVEPNSLPALRYGRRYAFRIAGVDLAGNSVPMDPLPTGEPEQAIISTAAAHLDALRTKAKARDDDGLLASASMRDKLTKPRDLNGDGMPAEVERAMASVVDNAASLRMHPEWNVDPKQLAALFADSGDANTVSSPRLFLRWDAIPAPTLVPRAFYSEGESLQRVVIRTGLTDGPGLCERHIVPPKGSQMEAEQDGRFDELMRSGDHARAYATALKERGNLFHTQIQDLNSPTDTIPQPGVELLATAGTTDPKSLEAIQHPEVQPAEGQYIVHNVDQLVLPYLPDPMADGVALVFYEAGADHRFSDPRVLQTVVVKYAGEWPEIQPLRLVLHTAPRLDAQQEGNVIHVGLPPGEQVAVAFSTTLDAEHLEKMALWRFHPVHDPNVPEADRRTLERAARDGWLWWLTPDQDLRLVHATARPAKPPTISRLSANLRQPNIATANLDGVIDVHGASTEKIELRARWDDHIDDPANNEPTFQSTKEIVVDHRINEDETVSLLTLQDNAKKVGERAADVEVRPAIHHLPDCKARTVHYHLHGTSRFREYFLPEQLPKPDDEASAGKEVAVNIPSSAAPAPPVVHDVIPMFMWEETTEPEHPFANRRIRRSGVRIWLDRPWYSSGDGEMLAVITTGDAELSKDKPEKVSLWARDPILAGPNMANTIEVPVLSAWEQRAVSLSLTPQESPGRPIRYVVKDRKPGETDPDRVVNAYLFRPEFDRERNRWFVDVILDSATAIWPFLRLSVARYQPNSIPDMDFSEVVATDFVQLPPERIGTVSRPEADEVRVSITGVTAMTMPFDEDLPEDLGDLRRRISKLVAEEEELRTKEQRGEISEPERARLKVVETELDQCRDLLRKNWDPMRKKLLELVPKSRRVVATLQARNLKSKSDIDWADVASAPCELAGVSPDTYVATWSAALPLKPQLQLLTPGTFNDLRVQVEEYELLPADPKPGEQTLSTTERLVYADHFAL
jgi:hypothetical protein